METTAEIAPHPSRDAWTSHLRSHGRRVTKQRLAVLDAVDAVPHATAEETVRQVRSVLPNMSVQSVYVVLADLAAANLAQLVRGKLLEVVESARNLVAGKALAAVVLEAFGIHSGTV